MDKISWIKELVQSEAQMEESGLIDFTAGFNPDRELLEATTEFLEGLKENFIEASTTFNQLKSSNLGRIKIYGISNTLADFMLFRNGFKLIFSMISPGRILIKFLHMGSNFMPGMSPDSEHAAGEDDILESRWGAFGDLVWQYHDHEVKIDYLIRYYMTRFIRESAR